MGAQLIYVGLSILPLLTRCRARHAAGVLMLAAPIITLCHGPTTSTLAYR